jgi:hypothetical protein
VKLVSAIVKDVDVDLTVGETTLLLPAWPILYYDGILVGCCHWL